MRTIGTFLLRAVLVILGLIIAGSFSYDGAVLGAARLVSEENITPSLDSDFRFISILTFGLCLTLFWLALHFERAPMLLHFATLTVAAGGLGRLYSWRIVGAPPEWMKIAIGLEFGLPALSLILFYSTKRTPNERGD